MSARSSVGRRKASRHVAVMSLAGVALVLGQTAVAQPNGNSLVPGIQPYAPKEPAASSPADQPPGPARPGATQPTELPAGEVRPIMSSVAAPPVKGHPGYDYILGAEDKLRITVYGEANLSGEFTIAGSGQLSFPLIGDVLAAGKTVGAVGDEITARLKDGYIKDPRVSVEVLSFRPFYLYGEVNKPGEYPYEDGLTVLNAIATAGGFTYRGARHYVFIKEPGRTTEMKVRLTPDVLMQPGETVRVAERLF